MGWGVTADGVEGRRWAPVQAAAGIELTPRERDVLRYVAAGLTTRQIAVEVGMGFKTVRTRLQWLFAKTGVDSRAQLAVWAVLTGQVTPEDVLAVWAVWAPEVRVKRAAVSCRD